MWWLAVFWVLPVLGILILILSFVRRYLNSKDY